MADRLPKTIADSGLSVCYSSKREFRPHLNSVNHLNTEALDGASFLMLFIDVEENFLD